MVELIVVRHGETIENTQGICQGQTDGTLSQKGKQQNKLLAKELASLPIHKIYSSPLKRALETAKEIHQFHKIALEVRDNLSELYLGSLQGQEFPNDFDISNLSEEMENTELVRRRLLLLLSEITSIHKHKIILLVSHGLTIKVLISILKNFPLNKINEVKLMKNSDYKRFRIETEF